MPIGGTLTTQWKASILMMLQAECIDLSNNNTTGEFYGHVKPGVNHSKINAHI